MTWSEATKSPPRGRGFGGGVTWWLHKNKGSELGTLIFVEQPRYPTPKPPPSGRGLSRFAPSHHYQSPYFCGATDAKC